MRSLVRVALILAVLPSCALPLSTGGQRLLNRSLLATSTIALACDMGQTIPLAASVPADQPFERNWIMGTHPSVGELVGYNGAIAGLNGALYIALPERRRWLVPLLLTAFEIGVVAVNVSQPNQRDAFKPWCGIR